MAICLKINTFNAATLILLEISSFWYGYQERQRHSYGKQNAHSWLKTQELVKKYLNSSCELE